MHRFANTAWSAALVLSSLAGPASPTTAWAQAPGQPAAGPSRSVPAPTPPRPARPIADNTPAGHGWVFIVDDTPVDPVTLAGGGLGTIMLHLPPRGAGQTEAGAAGGAARLAPGFPQKAEAIAWWQNRVYVALRDEQMMTNKGGDWQRRVFGITAVPAAPLGTSSKGGTGWEYPPGRPELVGTLPGKVELVSFGACKDGPVAMIKRGRGRGTLELSVCSGGQWQQLVLPWLTGPGGRATPSPGSSARYWIVSPRDGSLAVAVLNNQSDDSISVWTTPSTSPRVPAPAASAAGSPSGPSAVSAVDLQWDRREVSLRLSGPSEVFPVPEHVVSVGADLVATAWEPLGISERNDLGHVRLALLRPERANEFEPVPDVPHRYQPVPMDGREPRISLVWTAPRGESSAGEPQGSAVGTTLGLERITEISATTGRVLYSGPLKAQAWLAVEHYRLLALTLVVMMAGVVMFVLRRCGPSSPRPDKPAAGQPGSDRR